MSACGQTDCQVAKESLRPAELGRLKSGYRRSDDRDLQWLCWMWDRNSARVR
jgi:hypothetical protein